MRSCTNTLQGPLSVSFSQLTHTMLNQSRYWSNLPCDWPSTAWAFSEPKTDPGLFPWHDGIRMTASVPLRETSLIGVKHWNPTKCDGCELFFVYTLQLVTCDYTSQSDRKVRRYCITYAFLWKYDLVFDNHAWLCWLKWMSTMSANNKWQMCVIGQQLFMEIDVYISLYLPM